jgi:hypothetical protein
LRKCNPGATFESTNWWHQWRFVWDCIQSELGTRTYIGATNNFERRLKQHNRILSGGAKSTSGQFFSFGNP